jgi:hypothetical protein
MENKNEILRNIVQMKMEAKSLFEYYRGLEEKEIFNQALKDISNRIGSINIA